MLAGLSPCLPGSLVTLFLKETEWIFFHRRHFKKYKHGQLLAKVLSKMVVSNFLVFFKINFYLHFVQVVRNSSSNWQL